MNGNVCINAGVPNGNIELSTGNQIRLTINRKGSCHILNDEQTESQITGSLITNGGLSVGKNLFIGGEEILLSSSLTSIHPTTRELSDNATLNLCGGGKSSPDRGALIEINGNDKQ